VVTGACRTTTIGAERPEWLGLVVASSLEATL
jgi:hypothetical protein